MTRVCSNLDKKGLLPLFPRVRLLNQSDGRGRGGGGGGRYYRYYLEQNIAKIARVCSVSLGLSHLMNSIHRYSISYSKFLIADQS